MTKRINTIQQNMKMWQVVRRWDTKRTNAEKDTTNQGYKKLQANSKKNITQVQECLTETYGILIEFGMRENDVQAASQI